MRVARLLLPFFAALFLIGADFLVANEPADTAYYVARLPPVTDNPPVPPGAIFEAPSQNVPAAIPPATPPGELGSLGSLQPGQVMLDDGTICEESELVEPSLSWRIVTGVEATLLLPRFDDAPLAFRNGAGFAASSDCADLENATFAPRVWVGIENCAGFGIRATYWELTAAETTGDSQLAGPLDIEPELFRASRELSAWIADLEATYRFVWDGVLMLGSVGARHARLSRAESLTSLVSYDRVSSQMSSDSTFEGTGIRIGIEGWFPLDKCGQFQCLVRCGNSLLWGQNDSATHSLLTTPTANLYQAVVGDEPGQMFLFDFQAGVQWNGEIDCLDSYAFVRLMAECQMWNGNLSTFGLDQSFNAISQSASSRDLDVRFFGISIAAGVMW